MVTTTRCLRRVWSVINVHQLHQHSDLPLCYDSPYVQKGVSLDRFWALSWFASRSYTQALRLFDYTDCNILIACTVRHGAPWNIGCHVKKTLTFHHRVTWEYRYSAIIQISSIMNSYTCYTCQRQMQNKEKKVKDEK